MKISIDTKEDSHDEIKKVIKMLQNLVGDAQEVFINQPVSEQSTETTGSPFANIFGDTSSSEAQSTTTETQETTQETQAETDASESTPQSTEDLFAELFSEEELKKMDEVPAKEEGEEEIKPKDKNFKIEFY
ncbi:hypothetical protein HYX02_02455 [Candidatus Woesearchaeota archaeon]|nr:hypothetical protein [Candidatus Woesearchaeota archaeon]